MLKPRGFLMLALFAQLLLVPRWSSCTSFSYSNAIARVVQPQSQWGDLLERLKWPWQGRQMQSSVRRDLFQRKRSFRHPCLFGRFLPVNDTFVGGQGKTSLLPGKFSLWASPKLLNLGKTGYIRARAELYNAPLNLSARPSTFALALIGIPFNLSSSGPKVPFLVTVNFTLRRVRIGPSRRLRGVQNIQLFSGRAPPGNSSSPWYRDLVRLYSLSWGVGVLASREANRSLAGGLFHNAPLRCPKW